MLRTIIFNINISILILVLCIATSLGQDVDVGSGSYTKTFPGTDASGRNGYPSGTPFTTGLAANKPTPTNDWWSHKVKNAHSANLFNYPFTLKTVNEGLVVSYIPWGPIDDILPITVGVQGLNASVANVSDYSDWTVTMDWTSTSHHFTATAGICMPFIYFTKTSEDVVQISVAQGEASILDEMLIIKDARNGADFAVYAPVGSTWNKTDNTYSSSLNGQNYWSLGFIPLNSSNVESTANKYKKYAYVFPTTTQALWSFDEETSVVTTDFSVDVDVKEGSNSTILLGLLPHHWDHLKPNSPNFTKYTYPTVRGEMKTIEANGFSVENTFHGILPALPYLDYYSPNFSVSSLNNKVKLLENDILSSWTDSYNEGQEMNRLIQTARIAELSGEIETFNNILSTVKSRLEDWLKVQSNEVAFIFYYNSTWSALLGYPAGHGQDTNINDHHFHWGYFIHAASFIEQYEPGWANQWGEMVNLLVRDAASTNRDDDLFPFMRNFSPYAGHSWANGFASFPQGNDQESTSESMQFNSSLIHWGSVTGNDQIRDLGIYLYTTEQTAIEEYWFDIHKRNFKSSQNYSLVSRVWGNSYDNGTFWTSDIAASYGIELYPIHAGSLYLGHHTNYANELWAEIETNTGIKNNDPNVNLWHDVMWKYLSFIDPTKAIEMYDTYPERSLKFGISDADTYHWLHSMNVLGKVDFSITANHPLATAFNKDGKITYVAQNYDDTPIDVNFSTGYNLTVPPRKMATSRDISLEGVLSASFKEAYPGGSVKLMATITGGATKVEFYDGESIIGSSLAHPYSFDAENLIVGKHNFYARIYEGTSFIISNSLTVTVGDQLPYSGIPISIPGSFDAGHYDLFEGGNGNGIAYQDISINNESDFRKTEYVDASSDVKEGDVVGWIAPGEWLEYTIEVEKPGNYTLSFRYASDNGAGGGPFTILSNGVEIKKDISVNQTGGWNTWSTKTVNDVSLKGGLQILRLYFEAGEFNLGKLTFAYSSPLSYSQPEANAGANQVVPPQNMATLNGSGSVNPDGGKLSYLWTQVYGPSILQFSNATDVQPTISKLVSGVYLLKLEVDNGSYKDDDLVYIISSSSNNAPKISILHPPTNMKFIEGTNILISAIASDLDDSVVKVDFLVDNDILGSLNKLPYEWSWKAIKGTHQLTAIAHDSFGDSTISNTVIVNIDPVPPCEGTSWDGDFSYQFSPDDENPTITFVTSQAGVGNPTCILYYGTDPGNMPGYGVTPNVPYKLNVSKGAKIYFYYTYSFPGAVEKNNSEHKNTYVIGSCKTTKEDEEPKEDEKPKEDEIPDNSNPITALNEFGIDFKVNYYPNPITNFLHIPLKKGLATISAFNFTGQLLQEISVSEPIYKFDMREYRSGLYLFKIVQNGETNIIKVIKK